jgi:DNA-binding NtrC family response regulator
MTKEILLIDDDEDELEVFTQALHSIDKTIKCSLAKNLTDALEFLSYCSPAYIFIDFNMPKVNGLECLPEIKKLNKLEKSRIVLYSNHISEEMNETATAMGVYRCVKKPNMTAELVKKIKEILKS